ncbi:hypothetical protein ACFSTH_19985 [Paenibacillus yanchengensis]|uniref:Apea-like HEPN domain-containing protein n=1 Tax=Paenibacillus yanchengensis TaxID=2035833 RepID=A0ABW4YMI7_9BACL
MMEEFLNKMCDIIGSDMRFEINSETVIINIKDTELTISTANFDAYLTQMNNLLTHDEDILISSHSYEVIIDYGMGLREDSVEFDDIQNNLNYRLGRPSIEFMFYLIHRAHGMGRIAQRRLGLHIPNHRLDLDHELHSFEDLLFLMCRRVMTLKITSVDNKSMLDFKNLGNSLTFEVSFNTGITCIQIRYIDELLSNTKIRTRRNRLSDCEAPKRMYESDLIYHYLLGQSSHHLEMKFLSFYHVLEHYFNIVYTKNMVQKIQDLITKPSFSPKRETDIEKLIKEVKNNFKIESESHSAKSEIEALKLVMNQYVDIESLKMCLLDFDTDLLNYYSNNIVEFSQGTQIDFNDLRSLPGKLAQRIYKTRNALIHSKAYEKERYISFEHEGQLLREIPLIQSIAEEIIIKTSKII